MQSEMRHTVQSRDPVAARFAAHLEKLERMAETSAAAWDDDDWQDVDENSVLLPNASDDEDADSDEEVHSEEETDTELRGERPCWMHCVSALDVDTISNTISEPASWLTAVIMDERNLQWVFVLCFVLQVLMYISLFVVQDEVKDSGLFVALSLLGAILLGLQSGQGLEHFKQSEIRAHKNNLLYKTTKRLTFHGKMIFYPMMVLTMSMCICLSSIYTIMLRYGSCAVPPDPDDDDSAVKFQVIGVIDADFGATFGFNNMKSFASGMIKVNVVLQIMLGTLYGW